MSATTALIFLTSLIVLGAGAAVALYFGRRTKDSNDWTVAGRSLPLYVVVFTQFATAAGGGVLVAHVGIAYDSGLSVFMYKAFVIVGFLILATIATWLRREKFSTVPEILRRLYSDHPVVTSLAALGAIVVPFGWLATQFVAFAKLFSQMTGIDVPVLITVMAALSLIVVLPGGLLSVAWSDFLFGVFMVIMSLVMAGYALNMAGGLDGIAANVPRSEWSFPDGLGAAGSTTILLWMFSIVPGTLTNQLYYQRVFATGNARLVRRGLIISAVLSLVSGLYAAVIGLSVRAQNPSFSSDEAELAAGWFLDQVPTGLLVIYAAFLMATIVSTTGSSLQSVVTNLVRDVYVRVLRGEPSEQRQVRLSRLLTVAVSAVAAVLAITFPTALDWLVATYAYSASMLAAPIFLGYLLHKRFELVPTTALGGMGGGLVGCAVAHVLGTTIPYAIYGIATSAVCMLIAHLVVAGRRPVSVSNAND